MFLSDVLLSSPGTVLGSVLVLVLVLVLLGLGEDRGPPGPRAVPLLGNLLQLDLKRPHHSLTEVSDVETRLVSSSAHLRTTLFID